MDNYLIGDILLQWNCDEYSLMRGDFMERFRYDGAWTGECIQLTGCVEDLIPYTQFPCLERNRIYDRYDVSGEPFLIYHWGYLRNAFGIWPRRAGTSDVMCMFDPALKTQHPVNADWFFGVSGLHCALLQKNAAILHASYVAFEDRGILFTAPSQTGKSTQADLWQRFAGAQIINGDRVLLRKKDGIWHAYGFPCCGSSNICVDKTLPVAAIVVLEQGKVNVVSRMESSRKIRALASGTEVYIWESEQITKALDIAAQIADAVPVIKLSCTPDERAVDVLKQHLKEIEHGKCI